MKTNKAVARFLNRIEETAVGWIWVCADCGVCCLWRRVPIKCVRAADLIKVGSEYEIGFRQATVCFQCVPPVIVIPLIGLSWTILGIYLST